MAVCRQLLQMWCMIISKLWAKKWGYHTCLPPFPVISISHPLPLSLLFILPQIYIENLGSA